MDENQKKDLTNCEKECSIWLKLKALAVDRQYGTLNAKIIFHNGRIKEISYKDFEGSIRG